jgi:hypothetical protein
MSKGRGRGPNYASFKKGAAFSAVSDLAIADSWRGFFFLRP